MLAGCSSAPAPKAEETKKKAEPPKPAEAILAKKAFYNTYTVARMWASDVQPFKIESMNLPEVKADGGKFGAWRITYVSPSKKRMKVLTYSVIESEGNAHEGVYSPGETGWGGPTGQEIPFVIQAFKTDSDAALKTAMEKSDAIKKNPKLPVAGMHLEFIKRFPNPVWRIYFGDSVGGAAAQAFVDTTSGDFLKN
ncbi:MAG: hypothetical protein K2Q23_16675, partial [Bryobacteraceae bacterium]|nr:hypothetical protein [Bryobacteraceae bacterium]